MISQFDIKILRKKWKYHVDTTNKVNLDNKNEIVNSPSLQIKYFAKLNFYNRLLDNTNELTTRDELIELLNEMKLNPTIPQDILDREYYLEQWEYWIRFTRI